MAKQHRRAIVFDFDGTVADTVPLIRDIYAELASKHGWSALTDVEYEKLRKGTLKDARKWAGIRFWQLPKVVRSAKLLLQFESEKVTIFPGMIGLIRELAKEPDIDLYVLSRNTKDTIEAVLERKNLHNQMQVLGRRRLLGSKTATLRYLARQKGYRKKDIIMVGDEVRDVRAAKRARVRSVAVSWGIQHESILKRYRPNYIATSVDELKEYLYRNR